MICPVCKSSNIMNLFEDNIKCGCGEIICIHNYFCLECGFDWRLQNGEIIDSIDLEKDKAVKFINSFVEGFLKNNYTPEEDDNNQEFESLKSALHSCLKCGCLAIQVNDYEFMCTNCGFEWEIEDCG